jgi:site-specific DNA recombinase
MRTDNLILAFSYLRLSREEEKRGESTSITNQRLIVNNYCQQNGITLVREFADDGWSGGNFERPGFQEMMRQLDNKMANLVVTKDLSRLGRDMRESSYFAEQFFPEHGVRYIAIADGFDTENENVMAPFQFAMNEVYLRDGSRKVKDVLRAKRERGQYCACPPYGYRKDENDNDHLVPDEMTAPIVKRIFAQAAGGDSSRTITMALNEDGVVPPLKYRVLYRDQFKPSGAARASEQWNYTTVKRILKNEVYLGHTILGKTKKASVKSAKKISVARTDWCISKNTHEPIVSEHVFALAQENLGRGASNFRKYDQVRKSIFGGTAFCGRCGHALCSCGTVYKGEREKYWFLSCTKQRKDIEKPCAGVRIRYADLAEIVRRDLNSLISMTDRQIRELVQNVVRREKESGEQMQAALRSEKAQARILTIDKIVEKLYTDNAEGRMDDERLMRMVAEYEKETAVLKKTLAELSARKPPDDTQDRYQLFFTLAKQYTYISELDKDTLQTFVERIEVGPKTLPDGLRRATHRNVPFTQEVRIYYRFIGEISEDRTRQLPMKQNTETQDGSSHIV